MGRKLQCPWPDRDLRNCQRGREGAEVLKASGAKRVMPLQVHGAFHSGLMQSAKGTIASFN